jgi:hypothetical protein
MLAWAGSFPGSLLYKNGKLAIFFHWAPTLVAFIEAPGQFIAEGLQKIIFAQA